MEKRSLITKKHGLCAKIAKIRAGRSMEELSAEEIKKINIIKSAWEDMRLELGAGKVLSELEQDIVELGEKYWLLEAKNEALKADNAFQINEMAVMQKEIQSLRGEKGIAAGTIFDLRADCRCKDEEIAVLARKNQELLEKSCLASLGLVILGAASIGFWDDLQKEIDALESQRKESEAVFCKDVVQFIGKMRKEMQVRIIDMMAELSLSE
jgi:hypothetical protein